MAASADKPPRIAEAVLTRCVEADRRADVLGDLEEEYRRRVRLHGRDRARWWFRMEALRFVVSRFVARAETVRETSPVSEQTAPPLTTRIHVMINDLRYGLRGLRRNPGFTVTVLATLTLGIGGNAAIFSAVNGILLTPLPYDESEQLVQLYEYRPTQGRDRNTASYPDFTDWREQSVSFQAMAAVAGRGVNLTGLGDPQQLSALAVTRDMFPLLRVEAAIGRVFAPDEFTPGNDRVVILPHGSWQRFFGGDPAIVGTAVTLDGNPFTVIGVLPEDFAFVSPTDVWLPFAADGQPGRGSHFLRVFARLSPGVTVDRARGELGALSRRLEREYPDSNTGHYATLFLLQDEIVRNSRTALLVLLGAVGLVLLLVCVNVANMQFARSLTREREVAIRTTLGATRGRIVTQLLWENLVLALVAAVLGTLLAASALGPLAGALQQAGPLVGSVTMDARVFGFVLLVSLVALVIFGLAPAARLARAELGSALRDGGSRAGHGVHRHRMRSAMVVAEFALAIVLLVGAGLMTRSFARLVAVDPGFAPDGLLTARISLSASAYDRPERQHDFVDRTLTALRRLPDVRNASLNWLLPFTGMDAGRNIQLEGREPVPGRPWNAAPRIVESAYFSTMEIPLLRGRPFEPGDRGDGIPVVIVNESMARAFWPGDDAIGQRLRLGQADPWREVVGVVGDVSHLGLDAAARPEMYLPYSQAPVPLFSLVVRTDDDPTALADPLRRTVWAIDPNQPVSNIATMRSLVGRTVGQPKTNTAILGAFALVALVLAAVGVYGVMSFSVRQRTREIGVRIALGATSSDVLAMVLGRGLVLMTTGIVIGLAGAVVASRGLAPLLYEIGTTDFATYAVVVALLAGAGLAANYFPAHRATRLDPARTLRQE